MATKFDWKIVNLERYTADNVVYIVHYKITASDGKYFSEGHGSVKLEAPEPDSKIPFEELTEEIVVDWILEKFGEEKIKKIIDTLQGQIDEKINPTRADGLPWEKSIE